MSDKNSKIPFHVELGLELARATVTAGQSALKAAILMNGGAAVAVLTFIGHESSTSLKLALACSIAFFTGGVLGAVAASGMTYLGQWFYSLYFFDMSKEKLRKAAFCLNGVAIIFVLLSYSLFCVGTWNAYKALASTSYTDRPGIEMQTRVEKSTQ